jgi:hypothetical protein
VLGLQLTEIDRYIYAFVSLPPLLGRFNDCAFYLYYRRKCGASLRAMQEQCLENNFLEQNLSWEANCRSASHNILRTSWNTRIRPAFKTAPPPTDHNPERNYFNPQFPNQFL